MIFLIEGIISIAAIAVSLAYLVYKQWTNKSDYWLKKKIVSAPSSFLFGSYREVYLWKCNIYEAVRKIYFEFNTERFVGSYKWTKPELIIRDPVIINKILNEDSDYFTDRGSPQETQDLFKSTGNNWECIRQAIAPSCTKTLSKDMFHLLVETGVKFQGYVHDLVEAQNDTDIRNVMIKFIEEAFISCAFGTSDKKLQLKKYVTAISQRSTIETIKHYIRDAAPEIFDRFKVKDSNSDAEDFFLNLFKTEINNRQNQRSSRNDYIDCLIELKTLNDNNFNKIKSNRDHDSALTDEMLSAQACEFFTMGFQTSSCVVSFALHEIATNRDILKRLLKEIDTVLSKHDNKISYESVEEMNYLDMVVDETARKYPPIGVLNRVCKKNYKIPDSDVEIDEGVFIAIPIFALHNDDKYFRDPLAFYPERFLAEKKAGRPNSVYLPFGEGPRNCIGHHFGKLVTKTAIVYLLQKYSIETTVKTKYEFDYDPGSFVLKSGNGMWLKIRARNN